MSRSCISGSRRMSRSALDTSFPLMLPGCAQRLRVQHWGPGDALSQLLVFVKAWPALLALPEAPPEMQMRGTLGQGHTGNARLHS